MFDENGYPKKRKDIRYRRSGSNQPWLHASLLFVEVKRGAKKDSIEGWKLIVPLVDYSETLGTV